MDKKNRKYMLLGLGVGIILTNVIYYHNPRIETEKLDDSQIIERARELGMVTMKESIKTENKVDEKKEFQLEPIEGIEKIEGENDQDENPVPVEEDLEESKEIEEDIVLEVDPGDGLLEIAEKLKKNELIKDVNGFKSRVYGRKVSKKLQPGEFKLNKEMTFDEIIDKIIKSEE